MHYRRAVSVSLPLFALRRVAQERDEPVRRAMVAALIPAVNGLTVVGLVQPVTVKHLPGGASGAATRGEGYAGQHVEILGDEP